MAGRPRITSIDDETDSVECAQVASSPVAEGGKVTVTIHPSEGDGGNDAVPVQVNGYAYQIPRGKPVQVPESVYEVLRNAKITSYYRDEGGKPAIRETQRFAFSVDR